MTKPVLLVVAAALFDAGGRILLAQRPEGKQLAGLWEFPGGKLEPGEAPEAALVRELEEELSITVNESSLEPLTFASFAYPDFHLIMPLYGCKEWSGFLRPREGQAIAWVEASRLRDYPAPPADLPLFDWLARRP
ncbi:(deoxy)nucleoside triphosphate pyrophosphohydrolase [Hyphomonas sp.]|jgi:8-oxo-dGTP diphosphatase|uniref:(deoxy)nucleoside triphosphate pyrophosphohydrolase n=1 Tax=Hyphomonas sp. TaxID=87 RepID=UPI0025C5CC5D|nr:(deoxy)nucleoside triphosphate pyrophosphohydrolase [Hyphomonas sp.]